MKNLRKISIVVSSIILIFGVVIIGGRFILKNQESGNKYIKEKIVEFRNGDLIFQTSKTKQSKAVQLATKSKYSHMGVIYNNDGNYYVYEAIQPVQLTVLKTWIERGEDSHYVVKRLKNADNILSQGIIVKMKEIGDKYMGLDYDIYFEWSDDRMYCSELVWKIYKQACDIEIGELQLLKEFDLSSDIVKQLLHDRYGQEIPLDEKVISPERMFNSEKLCTIYEN